jgi:hypothetical protein
VRRSKCASCDHIVGAPEREADTERHGGRRSSGMLTVKEFKRLSRLNENIGKSDQKIWEVRCG